MADLKRVLEQATNVAIIVVCGIICWSYLTGHFALFAGKRPIVGTEQLVGLTLPAMPGYSWRSQPETLVVAIRVGCHYCADSMPFYRKLIELERGRRLKAHLLIAMQEDKQAGDKELLSDGLNVDHVFGQSFRSLRVTGTPTLTLLDSHGRVNRVWVGELSPEGEQEVISNLGE